MEAFQSTRHGLVGAIRYLLKGICCSSAGRHGILMRNIDNREIVVILWNIKKTGKGTARGMTFIKVYIA